jgi:hypothetical protein
MIHIWSGRKALYRWGGSAELGRRTAAAELPNLKKSET